MINHVATLIRNRDGEGSPTTPTGFYTSPTYRAVALPPAMEKIRALWFGQAPDAAMLDIRVRQFITLLESTELAIAMRQWDTRVVMPPATTPLPTYGTTVTTLAGNRGAEIGGDLPVTGSTGVMRREWDIEIVA